MKHTVILVLVLGTFVVVSAYAFFFSGEIRARLLPEAYQIAVETLGSRTNELVCVEGKRIKFRKEHTYKEGGWTEAEAAWWEFIFEGTNASQVVVTVTDLQPQGFIGSFRK